MLNIIDEDIATRQQGYAHTRTVNLHGAKVRTRIYRDSYDFQSYAICEVWSSNDLRWNEVERLEPTSFYKELPSHYDKAVRANVRSAQPACRVVADVLIAYAKKILTGV